MHNNSTATHKGSVCESRLEGVRGADEGEAVRVAVDSDVRGGVLHPICQLLLDVRRNLQLTGIVSLESVGKGKRMSK